MVHDETMNRSKLEKALNGQTQDNLNNKTMSKLILTCLNQY